MKRLLFLPILLVLLASAVQAQGVCTVYGRIDNTILQPDSGQFVTIHRVIVNGHLVSRIPKTVRADAAGYFSFSAYRGSTIYVAANIDGFRNFSVGNPVVVPNVDSAALVTMVPPVTAPTALPIIVDSANFVTKFDYMNTLSDSLDANPRIPDVGAVISDSLDANPRISNVSQSISDSIQTHVFAGLQKMPWSKIDTTGSFLSTLDTAGTTNRPEMTNIERALGQFTPSTSDSLRNAAVEAQQGNATASLVYNIAQGKAGADSVHTVLVALSNLIAGKGSADSIHLQLVTLYNLVAGKPNADSVHTAIDAMLKRADTTALHAQKFAVISDSLFAISLRATTTKNDFTAHIGTADAHLPAQTGQNGKFLQSNGTVSSWQTAVASEVDPTALSKASTVADSALSGGTRSISTTGRMFVADDSITFVGEAGDIINAALGNVFRGTLSGNDTLSVSNMTDGQILSIVITNAGTYTLGWLGVNWAGGTAPTLSATANKRDVFTLIRAGGITYGSAVQDLR